MKVLVSLEDTLLERIDEIARSRGMSRSAYLAELAAEDAARHADPNRVRRAMRDLDGLFADTGAEDSTAAVRAERDSR
jgi:metal-responsive CopG/Arc/MetJ family transcriptional regulator